MRKRDIHIDTYSKAMPGDVKTPDEIFDSFDADGNGTINKDELRLALNIADVPTTPKQITDLMTIIDTNGDGMVSKAEFRAFVGTSKVLTTNDVVMKMQATFASQLRAASNPIDIANIALATQRQQQQQQLEQQQNDAAEAAMLNMANNAPFIYFSACLLCSIGIGLLVGYIFGTVLFANNVDLKENPEICQTATTW